MNKKQKEKKKSERKKRRDNKILKKREAIREEARVKKQIERIKYENRERLVPIRNSETILSHIKAHVEKTAYELEHDVPN